MARQQAAQVVAAALASAVLLIVALAPSVAPSLAEPAPQGATTPTGTPTTSVAKVVCTGPPVPAAPPTWVPATVCPGASTALSATSGQLVYFLVTVSNVPFPTETYAIAVTDQFTSHLQFVTGGGCELVATPVPALTPTSRSTGLLVCVPTTARSVGTETPVLPGTPLTPGTATNVLVFQVDPYLTTLTPANLPEFNLACFGDPDTQYGLPTPTPVSAATSTPVVICSGQAQVNVTRLLPTPTSTAPVSVTATPTATPTPPLTGTPPLRISKQVCNGTPTPADPCPNPAATGLARPGDTVWFQVGYDNVFRTGGFGAIELALDERFSPGLRFLFGDSCYAPWFRPNVVAATATAVAAALPGNVQCAPNTRAANKTPTPSGQFVIAYQVDPRAPAPSTQYNMVCVQGAAGAALPTPLPCVTAVVTVLPALPAATSTSTLTPTVTLPSPATASATGTPTVHPLTLTASAATASATSSGTPTTTGTPTGTPRPASSATATATPTAASLTLEQAIALVQSSSGLTGVQGRIGLGGLPGSVGLAGLPGGGGPGALAGVPAADTVGQTVVVRGQVDGTGQVTGSMRWTLTASVPGGVVAGTIPLAVFSTPAGLQGFACTALAAGGATAACAGTTAHNALQGSTVTVIYAPGVSVTGTIVGPGPRPLLPPPGSAPLLPPIALPPPPLPLLVPLPAGAPGSADRVGEVPLIPETNPAVLLLLGLGAVALGRYLRRR